MPTFESHFPAHTSIPTGVVEDMGEEDAEGEEYDDDTDFSNLTATDDIEANMSASEAEAHDSVVTTPSDDEHNSAERDIRSAAR